MSTVVNDHLEPSENRVLKPSKGNAVFVLLSCAVFVGIGVLLIVDEKTAIGVMTVAFFGLGLLVGIAMLFHRRSCLCLSTDGFTVNTLLKSSFHRWSDVRGFRVVNMYTGPIRTNSWVMYDFASPAAVSATTRNLASLMGVGEAALPDTYGMKAAELVALMNEWREHNATVPEKKSAVN